MDKIQQEVWRQLLAKASEFTLQINDPVRWAKNFLNVELESNQEEIIKELCDPRISYLGILGARGCGKTFAVSIGLVKMCEDNPGLDVGVFGPRADQATRIIGETKKILVASPLKEQIDWEHTTNDKIIFKNGSNILALSAAETSLQEGWHFSVVVVDEAHRVSNASMSERIIPMLGSKKIAKLIKIGIPLFKNHFYASYSDDKYTFLVHDWAHAPILLKPGYKELLVEEEENGVKKFVTKRFPSLVLDRMPKALKAAMFPKNPEVYYDGDMTEMEFNTQYGMVWMDDINTFLRGEEPEMLVGNHELLMSGRAGEHYFFGLDTSSGTLTPGKYDLDFTALSIWRLTGNGTKERVWSREWQGGETLAQAEEIAGIIHPQTGLFPCDFGCVDYSNCGITSVEMFKRLKIPVAGVIFATTDPTSHKNYKNAMANQFQFELQAGRVKYPRMEFIDRDKIMRKHYHQWLALERNVSVGINDKICLSGDTKIPLLNGFSRTIKELASEDIAGLYTHSFDPIKNHIVPGKILKAWKTGEEEVLRITLDNGESFKCTANHELMMRDSSFKEAGSVVPGDSLMPLDLITINHKITKIERAGVEEVFDLTIEGIHNFAIDAGVFVHNCAPPNLHDDGPMCDFLAIWAADKNSTFRKGSSVLRIGIAAANTSIVQRRPGGSKRYL